MREQFRSDLFDQEVELSRESGFTLIELMVVVTIIAILAAIGLPELSKFVKKAETSDAITVLGALDNGMKAFRSIKGIDVAVAQLTTGMVSSTSSTAGPLETALAGYWSKPNDTKFKYSIQAHATGSTNSYCLEAIPLDTTLATFIIFWSSDDMSTHSGWDGKANITNYVNQVATVTNCS